MKTAAFLLAALPAMCCQAAAGAASLKLVADGARNYRVVVADDAIPAAKSVLHEGSSCNCFVRLGADASEIGNSYNLPATRAGAYRITCRARGKGRFRMWCASYHHVGGIEGYNAIVDGTAKAEEKPLSDEWRTYSLIVNSVGERMELLSIRFFRVGDGTFDIDDVYVEPLDTRPLRMPHASQGGLQATADLGILPVS